MLLGMSWIDWKLGGRMLVKYPGLSVIGGLTLAVAIGLGAGWFEVTRQLVNPRLPLEDGDRIVRIDNWDAAESKIEARSLYDFQLWRAQLTSVKELGAFRSLERNLITSDGNARPATVAEVSASAFPLTRVRPLIGRTLIDSDAEPGAADVAVIGYDIWKNRFDGDPAIVGRVVRIGANPVTIVGVMPEGFRFPVNHQVWLPLRLSGIAPRNGAAIGVFGRLSDGATLTSAQAELNTVGQRIAAANPATHAQLRPRIFKYAAPGSANESKLVRLSNIAAWLILAAACANVATLLFARTATRESEIVVRNALGASRGRVMMQLFVEAFVLCAVGAVVGLMAASFALDYVARLLREQFSAMPFWWQFTLSPITFAYALLLALGGAVLVGLLPALRATGKRVQLALTRVTTGSTNIQYGGVWSIMIVLQVTAAALCLPVGFFGVFDTLQTLARRVDAPTHEYLTFRPELDRDAAAPAGEVKEAEYRAHLLKTYESLKRRLESEPTVAGVTFANGLPGVYIPLAQVEAQRGNEQPQLVDANIEGNRVKTATVDIDFFDVFRMPLMAGRAFHAVDVNAGNVAIVNETLARNIGGDPLGVRIRQVGYGNQPPGPWFEVVGIVRDAGADAQPADFLFVPVSAATASPLMVTIHVRGNAAEFAPRVRALAAQVEPGLRLYDLLSLEEVVRRHDLPGIQGTFAVVALTLLIMALSSAGLYSLMSVSVTRRTREIGIRLAIGASPRSVLRSLFGRAALQVGIGILLGDLLLQPMMTALGQAELRLSVMLPSMLVASGGMLLTGLIACGVPARRALRVQPTEAVKYVG